MKRKQLLLLVAALFCALILSSSSALAVSGQQVKVPYVVSMSDVGWWTGIAITNNSGSAITDMKLAFTKDNGSSGWYMPPLMAPPPSERSVAGILMPYETDLDTISGYAILSGTMASLYAGEGTKTLPSDVGSVIFYHTGSESFTVTVSIGNANGFAYYVFESEGP
ncbi:MAG: hypothetical protein KAI69_00620 [Deltaproteobacteria bacterium]|nr:hypothetical protein [Deltaproteobacteria bacterium]